MTTNQNLFADFPDVQALLNQPAPDFLPEINGHIHTPHSFSAFDDIEQAFRLARAEGISVLGINDFYTTDGYAEFAGKAFDYRIFPLFNIEFMALQAAEQAAGIRVNDPNNPGRTYLSGKGLRFPVTMGAGSRQKMEMLRDESNRQTCDMVALLNAFLQQQQIDLRFDAGEIRRRFARNLLRERHIAKAVRVAVFEKYTDDEARRACFTALFGGKTPKSAIGDVAALENEIRGNLLKAGGPAFVPEDPSAFLSLAEVRELVTDAGGMLCYPVLLDDPKGVCTDYEADPRKLLETLLKNDIYSIELIPGRNDYQILKSFVHFFHENGLLVTFGTEHNTPQLDPLKVTCRGGVPLDDELRQINYEGTAVIAAHQYLVARGLPGYLEGTRARISEKAMFVELGKAVISTFINR